VLTAKADEVLRRLRTIHQTEIRDTAPRLIEPLSDLRENGPRQPLEQANVKDTFPCEGRQQG